MPFFSLAANISEIDKINNVTYLKTKYPEQDHMIHLTNSRNIKLYSYLKTKTRVQCLIIEDARLNNNAW